MRIVLYVALALLAAFLAINSYWLLGPPGPVLALCAVGILTAPARRRPPPTRLYGIHHPVGERRHSGRFRRR